jgi:predicted dinucleotide-binding enzyme
MRIAILGAGNVGGALGKAFASTGHKIFFGVLNPEDEKTGSWNVLFYDL